MNDTEQHRLDESMALTAKLQAETAKLVSETARLNTLLPPEVERMLAESRNLARRDRWYNPLFSTAAMTTAVVALAKAAGWI